MQIIFIFLFLYLFNLSFTQTITTDPLDYDNLNIDRQEYLKQLEIDKNKAWQEVLSRYDKAESILDNWEQDVKMSEPFTFDKGQGKFLSEEIVASVVDDVVGHSLGISQYSGSAISTGAAGIPIFTTTTKIMLLLNTGVRAFLFGMQLGDWLSYKFEMLKLSKALDEYHTINNLYKQEKSFQQTEVSSSTLEDEITINTAPTNQFTDPARNSTPASAEPLPEAESSFSFVNILGGVALAGLGAWQILDMLEEEAVSINNTGDAGDTGDTGDTGGTGGLGDVTVNSSNITLTVWDCGSAIDGDIIDLIVNGIYELSNYVLTANQHAVNVTLNSGDNSIQVHAVNEGSAGFNTACMEISNVTSGNPSQFWNIFQGTDATMTIYYGLFRDKDAENYYPYNQKLTYSANYKISDNLSSSVFFNQNESGIRNYSLSLHQNINDVSYSITYNQRYSLHSSYSIISPEFSVWYQNKSLFYSTLSFYARSYNIYQLSKWGDSTKKTFTNSTSLNLSSKPFILYTNFYITPTLHLNQVINSENYEVTDIITTIAAIYQATDNISAHLSLRKYYARSTHQNYFKELSNTAEYGISFQLGSKLLNGSSIYDLATNRAISYQNNISIPLNNFLTYRFYYNKYLGFIDYSFTQHQAQFSIFKNYNIAISYNTSIKNFQIGLAQKW